MKKKIDTVYILGLGALGGIYAAKLYDMNPSVLKIIASKDRIAALKANQVTVNDKAYSFDFVSPGEQDQQPADLIIVAVKSLHLQEAINDIRGFIGKDTIIISLLNGISSEELIGEKIGMNHLLYAYGVGMDAVREGGAIRYKSAGKVVFGEKNNEVLSERVQAVKDLFEQADISYQIPVDMYKALWVKFMMNVGINQVSAMLKEPYGAFQHDGLARTLMLLAANEVLDLSRAVGIHLSQSDIEVSLQIIDGLNPSGKTSMLQDIEAGRRSEVDLFAGTVIELGKKYGVPTPVNETLSKVILSM